MSHYRTIEIDGRTFQYVVGNHRTKVNEVVKTGAAFTATQVGLFNNSEIGYVYDEDKVEVRPSHVEKAIRRELSIAQREYEWDTPITKKSDPGPRTRGFRSLIGVTIDDIRVSAINEVLLVGSDGTRYAIETNDYVLGIGVIRLRVLDTADQDD